MIIRIRKEQKDKLHQLAKREGKNSSEVVRELIEDYIQNRDIEGYIDTLWNQIGKNLKRKGIGKRDIEKAVKDVRKSKR